MAKRAKPKQPANIPEPNGAYIRATVTLGEGVSSQYANVTGRDAELVARSVSGTVYRAASINATVCASLPLRLFRPASAASKMWRGVKVSNCRTLKRLHGERGVISRKSAMYAQQAGDVEEVIEHPALELLRQPDGQMIGMSWFWLTFFFREVAGRSYAYLGERIGGDNGFPASAYVLYPQWTWPQLTTGIGVTSYRYGRNRPGETEYAARDVFVSRPFPSPISPWGASTWLTSVTLESDAENAAMTAEIQRWQNGGQPGMVLAAGKDTTDNQMAQIRAYLDREIRGVMKAGSPLLVRDTTVTQMGAKPHELNYRDGLEIVEKRIYDAAGVPESIYRLNSANLASAEVSDYQYAKYTIGPRVCSMADELTEYLLPHYGVEPGEMWFAFDDPCKDDRSEEAKLLLDGVKAGVVTPNEWRSVVDLEPLEDDDNQLRFNGQPMAVDAEETANGEQTGTEAEQDAPAEDQGTAADSAEGAGDSTERKSVDHGEKSCESCCHPVKSPAGGLPDTVQLTAKAKPKPNANPATGLDTSLDDWVNAFAADLEEHIKVSVAESRLGNGKLAPPSEKELERMYGIIDHYGRQFLARGAQDLKTKEGLNDVSFSVFADEPQAFIDNRKAVVGDSVPNTFRQMLESKAQAAADAGATPEEADAALTAEVPAVATERAHAISTYEAQTAYAEGRKEMAVKAGMKWKKWILYFYGETNRTCLACIDFASQDWVKIDHQYNYTENGHTKYTDGETPLHQNCNCEIVYAFEPKLEEAV